MTSRIEDYAMLSDCQTAALVSREGSVDWLCFPRFDSPACFARLLGEAEHGHWQIAPQGEIKNVTRRYRDGSLVLETTFETGEGSVTLVDCMPPRNNQLDLVRTVVGNRGKVPMKMELRVRFDYGSRIPWVTQEEGSLKAVAGPDMMQLKSPVPLHGEGFTTVAEFTVSEGEQVPFVLMWHPSHEEPEEIRHADSIIDETEQWWQDWSSKCTYEGDYHEAVLRSLITLKGLTYHPTGGIVAAPTTSLPEHIGGVRNWDYRFCWLRDATITLYALLSGGYNEEACRWREWLLRAVAGVPSQISIMYGIAGESRLPELALDWLPGYEGSAPVRVGNGAWNQFQLDVYGEVMDAIHLARRSGLPVDKNVWRVQRSLIEHLEKVWTEPDEGIWEVRGERQHFVHSKVMAWVAVDRMIKSAKRFDLEGNIRHWKKLRQTIHDEVCAKGFHEKRNSFVQFYGTDQVDAALLMIPLVGFLPVTDPRMEGTLEAIEKDLKRDGLVHRYVTAESVDGLPPGEGAFLPCSFWLADNYLLQGKLEQGKELFEELLALRNDVGLLSEEYSVRDRRMLGNFPQAFTHVALVSTACNLSELREKPNRDRAS